MGSSPRLLLGAPASGTGKTTFACGLMHALVRRGLRVAACKCGPDYIDPMFHREVIGAPSRNLDLFFSSEDQVRALVADSARDADIVVLEGAMGYYDGIAVSDEASAWDVARATDTPAVLVVDGRGRARSIAAEVLGFARFRKESHVAGIVLNRVSPMIYPRLKELVEQETGVRVYGFVPKLDDVSLESRHLGLVTAAEVVDLRGKLDVLAGAMEETVDIDGLLELARTASQLLPWGGGVHPVLKQSCFGGSATGTSASCGTARGTHPASPGRADVAHAAPGQPCLRKSGVRVAVAMDDAFCFYYADTLRLLEAMGAELSYFSPLADTSLPDDVSGLYLGGGYPELHARELSENAPMRESIAAAIRDGMPTIAECGGFLYLHERLEGDDGEEHSQVGIVPGRAYRTSKLGRFGYVTLTAQRDGLLAAAGEELRAHEFHYWESEDPGDAFAAQKPQSSRGWRCCISTPTLHAGFPHLYLPSHPQAAKRFVEACASFSSAGARRG